MQMPLALPLGKKRSKKVLVSFVEKPGYSHPPVGCGSRKATGDAIDRIPILWLELAVPTQKSHLLSDLFA
jgi:hypothetical protein